MNMQMDYSAVLCCAATKLWSRREVGAGKHFVDAVSWMHSFIIYDLNEESYGSKCQELGVGREMDLMSFINKSSVIYLPRLLHN